MPNTKVIGLTIALVAGGLALSLGSAFAGCTSAAIGPTTGNPEKDTVGCARQDLESTGSVSGMTAPGPRSVAQVGSATGNPEKDTFGYVQAPAAQ
jgi:hypothetical protein